MSRAPHPWFTGDIEVTSIGELDVSTGAIVACDPLVSLSRAQPFTRRVAPGRYRVELALRDGDVLFATLVISDTPIARWVPALCPGEEPVDNRVPGYPVDAGTGCFVDAATAAAWARVTDAWESANVERVIASGVDPANADAWHAAMRERDAERPDLLGRLHAAGYHKGRAGVVVPVEGGNLAAFSSGAGDGVYSSYWALDAAGNAVALLTDFGLLGTDDEDDNDDVVAEPEADDNHDAPLVRLATRIVEQLLSEELLVLVPSTKRARFCDELAEALAEGIDDKRRLDDVLAEFLEEHDDVDDVYATDNDFARLVESLSL